MNTRLDTYQTLQTSGNKGPKTMGERLSMQKRMECLVGCFGFPVFGSQ